MVLIGVSHWHTLFFLDPSCGFPDVTIVGVSDPTLARAETAAAQARCRSFTDYREMCATPRPDSAFALARHCDMANLARFLIDQRIPVARRNSAPLTPPKQPTSPTGPPSRVYSRR
ncbi:Gfo/Idh/MocA family oxidoreductase [Rhodopila sp.]|uniref:Gfo/Idh/MocA family oxidoreductase n=1 Tax=Rhodopila sp. TaxID=2480087 RepID=UPI003D0AA1B0